MNHKKLIIWFLAGWLLGIIVSPKQILGYFGKGSGGPS